MHACIYIHVCACVCVCVCLHICIYANKHVYTVVPPIVKLAFTTLALEMHA